MKDQDSLSSISTKRLLEELRVRIAEVDEARALLSREPAKAAPVRGGAKSAAKAAYWRGWKAYRQAHPSATVAEWRESQRTTKEGVRGSP